MVVCCTHPYIELHPKPGFKVDSTEDAVQTMFLDLNETKRNGCRVGYRNDSYVNELLINELKIRQVQVESLLDQ